MRLTSYFQRRRIDCGRRAARLGRKIPTDRPTDRPVKMRERQCFSWRWLLLVVTERDMAWQFIFWGALFVFRSSFCCCCCCLLMLVDGGGGGVIKPWEVMLLLGKVIDSVCKSIKLIFRINPPSLRFMFIPSSSEPWKRYTEKASYYQ